MHTFIEILLGWVIRIYAALDSISTESNYKLMHMLNAFPFVHLCNVSRVFELRNITRKPIQPPTWRFLPLLDPLVDRYFSRDCDALITFREVAAVNEWLMHSNATFHLMRDHQHHCSVNILAGILLLFVT